MYISKHFKGLNSSISGSGYPVFRHTESTDNVYPKVQVMT